MFITRNFWVSHHLDENKKAVNRNSNKSANQMSINIKNMKNVMIHTCKRINTVFYSLLIFLASMLVWDLNSNLMNILAERNTIKQNEIKNKWLKIGFKKSLRGRSPQDINQNKNSNPKHATSTIVPIDGKVYYQSFR